jgi:hypothetical protein
MSTEPTPTPPRNLHGLDLISTEAMLSELTRRMRGHGDFPGHITPVLILALTPEDLVDYWECDDAGNTHPGSRVPSEDAWRKMRKTFEVWQDVGAYSELMSCLRETWIQADPESFQDDKEGTK